MAVGRAAGIPVLFLSFLVFSCWLPVNVQAADQWTIDDILLTESASDFQISPDLRWVVWVKSQMDKEKERQVSNLFLSSLTEKREIQLTRGTDSNESPKWSPDGKLIAFLSSRPVPGAKEDAGEKSGLWLMSTQGGEPWPAFEGKRRVEAFEWRDGKTIVFMAEEDPSLYELERKEAKDTSRVIDDAEHQPPSRLYLLNLEDKSVRRITRNHEWMQGFDLSPDGRWAAAVLNRSLTFSFDHKLTPIVSLIDLGTGEMKTVAPERRMVPRGVEWEPDSSGFYFATEYSSHPVYFTAAVGRLLHYDLGSGATTEVDLEWDRGLGGAFQATPDGFIALLADGRRMLPARYIRQGGAWKREELAGTHQKNIWDWKLSKDGRLLVYHTSTAAASEQWYQAALDGNRMDSEKQLTDLNPAFKKKPPLKVEMISWKGARGDAVEGILYYPIAYESGKRYPLMHSIHGGPTGTDFDMWADSWASPITLLAQKGAFVLETNYHGSANYGLEWVESICCGNYYDLERVDLENGVDYLIERGLVDPDRLGSMGWSNGSILTTELVTRSRRYKVASAGAGDVEWISDWGNVMFGASFDNYYFGKAPYEDPETYIRKSPYFRLKDVTTPTIIYTGTDDVNVPPSQSWSHFRVLQQATSTPVRFLVFPGEPHGLRNYAHQRRKVEEDMAWFDRHLFHADAPKNPAVKKNSPLETALKVAGASQVDGLFGEPVNGVLAPETVPFEGFKVGRFEVTRAQFAAFDPGLGYPAGTGNHPVAGVSLERALAYVGWLNQKTGRSYRLPNPEEAGKLYTSAGDGENTLDYWAGYDPNPTDATELLETAQALPGLSPLLTKVGSFRGKGEGAPVFDLGGNVAEWVVAGDGTGELRGGCAACPVETKEAKPVVPEGYRGFRVMLP